MPENTVPAEFVKIEDINELPFVANPMDGNILFFDENDTEHPLKMADLKNFKKEIQTGIVSDATPSSSPTAYNPTDYPDGLYEKYDVKTAGTYTNFLDGSTPTPQPIQVTTDDLANNYVQIWVKNGVSQKTLSSKLQPTQFIPAFSTSTFPLVSSTANPVQRTYNNAIWYLPAGQTAQSTDVPGVSSMWVKFNDIKTSSIPAGKNKFNKNDIIPETYINTTTWLLTTVAGNANFKTTKPIRLEGGPVSISGLPSIHNAAGYLWLAADGVTDVGHNYINANTTSATITPPAGAEYVQITVNTSKSGEIYNPDTIQIEFSSAPTAYEAYIPLITQINDYNLTVEKVRTDPLKSQSPISVAYFNANALKKSGITLETGGKNLFNKDAVISGQYVLTTSGAIQSVPGNTTLRTSEIIKIDPSSSIAISGLPSIHNALGYRWLAADKVTQVGYGATASNVTSAVIVAPSNAYYFQITVNSGKSGEVYDGTTIQMELNTAPTAYEAYYQVITHIEGYGLKGSNTSGSDVKTKGKLFFLFGDSITATAGADGSPVSGGNWPSYAFPLLKATYTNFALSGAHIEDFTTEFPRRKLSVQIADAIATGIQPDAIVVSIGINSLNVADNDYATTMGKDLTALDITKVMDAMRINLRKIYESFPNAVLYYGTPMQAIKNGLPDEELTQRKIVEQFKLMARTFNFKIIDAFEEVGIVRDFEFSELPGRYLTDGLHPNAAGKEKQGKYYANRILAQYPG